MHGALCLSMVRMWSPLQQPFEIHEECIRELLLCHVRSCRVIMLKETVHACRGRRCCI